ncbi:MAG TPA: hypothetical protein VMY42_26985 [Thermoguttaceae bacterium]|nr:hypothetical protein [Thermoguttaceae bacterium]
MKRSILARAVLWTTLALLTILVSGSGRLALGQDGAADTEPAVEKTKEFHGRLPNYYPSVVDEKQREAIYKIQEEYAARIDALEAQLAALTKERNEKVAAVLTPEQLKEVQRLAAKAKTERDAKKAATKEPAAGVSAT